MEGLALLIVVVFVLIKFNGLISRSTGVIESGLGSVLTAAETLSELTDDSSKTYSYKVKEHNSRVRGAIKADLEDSNVSRASYEDLDRLLK